MTKSWPLLLAALVAALSTSASAERIVEVEIDGETHILYVIEHGDVGDVISVSPEDVVLGPRVNASSLSKETGESVFPATSDEVWFSVSVSYANGVAGITDPETIRAGAEALVNQSNVPFRNSDVPHRFLVTELRHFQYDESGKLIDDSIAFNKSLAACDGRIHLLLVNGGDAAGIAGSKDASGCHSPVLTQNVKGYFPTFNNLEGRALVTAHEIGHGFKLHHPGTCVKFGGYNCGYCLPDGQGSGACDVMGPSGGKLPFFSNPEATYQGQPMGVHGQADAVRYLREELANYRKIMKEATPPLTCGTGVCVSDGQNVCLLGKFRILIGFDDPNDADDTYKIAKAEPYKLGPQAGTGLYSFFTEDNIEVMVKMLDACVEPFNRYWVFIAGLTNVETEVQVCNSVTGELKVYYNPQGVAFQSVQDTNAFTCDF